MPGSKMLDMLTGIKVSKLQMVLSKSQWFHWNRNGFIDMQRIYRKQMQNFLLKLRLWGKVIFIEIKRNPFWNVFVSGFLYSSQTCYVWWKSIYLMSNFHSYITKRMLYVLKNKIMWLSFAENEAISMNSHEYFKIMSPTFQLSRNRLISN